MNSRREQMLTLVVVGVLTVAFVVTVALPGSQAHAELRAQISNSRNEIDQGPGLLDTFHSEKKRLQQRQTYLDSCAGTLRGSSDLLHEISRIAAATGFRVVRIEPEQIRAQASYDELPFRVDFQAKVGTLARFLRELEANDRYFAIEELSMRNHTNGEDPGELEGKLRFVVYAARDTSADRNEENDSKG